MQSKNQRNEMRPAKSAGLSMVELMVALVLGLLITGGVIQLFGTSKLTFQTSDAMARVQENSRFAGEVFKREFRQVGASGFCAGRIQESNHSPNCAALSDDFFPVDWHVTGWEFDNTGEDDDYEMPATLEAGGASSGQWSSTAPVTTLPTAWANEAVPGSDVLMVRRLNVQTGVTLDGPLTNPSNNTLELNQAHTLGDATVLVTNCASGVDVFQNRTDEATKLRRPDIGLEWSTSYDESMQVFDSEVVAYFVGINPGGTPSLYRSRVRCGIEDAEELVEGVESMQVLYGYSFAAPAGTGQSVDRWLTADQVPDDGWPQVIALEIGFSVRSANIADGLAAADDFLLARTNVQTPADGRMRHPFATTIAFRNRVVMP